MDHSIISAASHTISTEKCIDKLPIPVDLVIEIFLRLPAKSVARNRCLSKFWANVLRSQHFLDLFAAKHSAPQILFVHKNESRFSFFSAHQNVSGNIIAPTYLTHYPIPHEYYGLGVPIKGLVCISEDIDYWDIDEMVRISEEKNRILEPVIYNLSTQEFLTLPKMNIRPRYPIATHFLGYDPTENQFKVLSCYSTEWYEGDVHRVYVDSFVLTLGTKQLSWRRNTCGREEHVPISRSEICINGVLYYRAYGYLKEELIVCFDVRSETFRFIDVMATFKKRLHMDAILTNYDGKLGFLVADNYLLTGESVNFELWVLKNAEKQEWSNHVYVLPPDWKNLVGETEVFFVGMTGTNEIVFASSSSPYIFYYNIKENAIRRLSIQGMNASRLERTYMFLNHVENVSLYIN